MLCFVDGEWPLIGAPEQLEGVRLESERTIPKLVSRPRDLDAVAIERLTAILAVALPPRQGPQTVHLVEVVRSAHQLDNGDPDVAARAERDSCTVMTDTWSAAAS